jgi:hypothetical protein
VAGRLGRMYDRLTLTTGHHQAVRVGRGRDQVDLVEQNAVLLEDCELSLGWPVNVHKERQKGLAQAARPLGPAGLHGSKAVYPCGRLPATPTLDHHQRSHSTSLIDVERIQAV